MRLVGFKLHIRFIILQCLFVIDRVLLSSWEWNVSVECKGLNFSKFFSVVFGQAKPQFCYMLFR